MAPSSSPASTTQNQDRVWSTARLQIRQMAAVPPYKIYCIRRTLRSSRRYFFARVSALRVSTSLLAVSSSCSLTCRMAQMSRIRVMSG